MKKPFCKCIFSVLFALFVVGILFSTAQASTYVFLAPPGVTTYVDRQGNTWTPDGNGMVTVTDTTTTIDGRTVPLVTASSLIASLEGAGFKLLYAVEATATINFAGASGGSGLIHTLTTPESAADVLICTNAGAASTIYATPTLGKRYLVINTSGYQVTIMAPGQSGVAVANNTQIPVVGNGTDYVAVAITTSAISGATVNSTPIGGTTPAAGAFTTLTANNTVTFSPANHPVAISPTGSGTVTVSPVGALTVNPTAASTVDNTAIGQTTPLAADVTTFGMAAFKSATHDYGGAHADWTLSAAEGRARVFTATDADTTATHAIMPSGFTGVFFVSNTSTSAITWKYASSTGISNGTGKKQILVADGNEIYSLKADY